jgi:murein DD-endopeptidase MepM/ murein hydrolase activator NlpD
MAQFTLISSLKAYLRLMATSKGDRSLLDRMRDKYRLIIVDDETYEERTSFKLSRLNVLTVIASASLLISVILLSIVIYTPAKELIPGYSDANAKREAKRALERADEMEEDLYKKDLYLQNVLRVLKGEVSPTELESSTLPEVPENQRSNLNFNASVKDSVLRADVAAEERYNLHFSSSESRSTITALSSLVFFSPLRGTVSSPFNIATEHLGVDVVAPDKTAIKTALAGTVILSTWSANEGYVIAIQHADNLISIYKHNSILLKKTGELVRAGESVAIIGNSGELSDGPHLHLELWYRGDPLDPQSYILFN